jgi:aldehyde dehydrogenase (NAD+)
MMPALVLGNTVVLKPASDTPVSAAKVIQLMDEVGFPPGVVNFVMGPGGKAGDALIRDPDVDLISFTGSTGVGRKIATTATSLGKRVSLEMGGKNAIIVMDDGDLDLAVDAILWAAFGTTGQRCTACSRVLVHHRVKSKLVSRLVERAKKLRLGDGLNPKTDVGPVVNAGQLARIHRYVNIGRREGAKLLCGGRIASDGDLKKGHFYEPTVFDNVKPKMVIAQEEIFGPVVGIISIKDLDEAIRVNNDTAYGLSSAIFTRDVNKAYRAMRDITTGIVYVNAGTTGAEVQLPFGGTRGTGNGHREAGQAAIDSFSEWKTVYVDYSGKLQKAQIDDYES